MKKRFGFFLTDKTIISEKIKEAFSSVLPITIIVMLLCITVTPLDSGIILAFILGAASVVVGTGLFTLGADTAMTPIGSYVGSSVIKSKKIWLIIPVYFIVGVVITVSEPDLMVLAGRLKETVNEWVLIISIGAGVGFFLVVAFLRVILNVKFSYLLIGCYTIVFVLSFFVPKTFVPLAFDSGGVTTGPMSVPFIIAIGTGLASIRSDKNAEADGFGLTALCSIGPIIAVMILGIIYKPESIEVAQTELPELNNSADVIRNFLKDFPGICKEVAIALLPIFFMFLVALMFGEKISKAKFVKILIGVLYTFVGLVLFLVGVNFGFLPVGEKIGEAFGSNPDISWAVVPLGMLIGFFVVAAEPAVHVLTKQVYEITEGAIPKKMLSVSLMIGTAVSVGLAMLRILLYIDVMYFILPCYVISLALTFVVPEIFTAIAFDSGGVASGAMATGFIMPLALGLTRALGGNLATEGFGVVAFIAMTPLITIQIMGLCYKIKLSRVKGKSSTPAESSDTENEEIIG